MIPPDKHLQIGSSRAGRRPSIGRWHHLLPFFGAVAVNKRVVMDGKHSICRWRHLGNRRRAQGVDGDLASDNAQYHRREKRHAECHRLHLEPQRSRQRPESIVAVDRGGQSGAHQDSTYERGLYRGCVRPRGALRRFVRSATACPSPADRLPYDHRRQPLPSILQ
jgi:hypothetical protein